MSRRLLGIGPGSIATSLLAGSLLLSGCASPEPVTQVMAEIDVVGVPIGALGRVDVAVRSGAAEVARDQWELVYAEQYPARELPVRVAIVPRGQDASRAFEVIAVASAPGFGGVLSTRVRSGFVSGRTLWLPIVLDSRCAAAEASEIGCDETRDPESLPDWTGPTTGDAGVVTPRDGGTMADDAGPEPECRVDTDCGAVDRGPCQRAVCVDGECTYEPVSGPCDDGDACTREDGCKAGSCVGEEVTCGSPGAVCDPMTGVCGCPADSLPCPSGCLRGATCCPGTTLGKCNGCGTRTCDAMGRGYACVYPADVPDPPQCTNPGEIHCTGTDLTCGCFPAQRRICNDNCTIGGCFP